MIPKIAYVIVACVAILVCVACIVIFQEYAIFAILILLIGGDVLFLMFDSLV